MNGVIVDIQYYRIHGTPELKEATVLSFDAKTTQHFVFRSHYLLHELDSTDWKNVNYVCNELGVLHLYCGTDELETFIKTISHAAIIFVNGHEKKNILKRFLPLHRIIDLKTPFRIMNGHKLCDYPYFHKRCSLTNAYKIKNFLGNEN